MRQISLDTETTGLNPRLGHKIIEIGCIEIINRKITKNFFHTYINPERKIEESASKITGIEDKFLKNKPKFKEIIKNFINFLKNSDTIIIHNANFDIGFINNELSLIKYEIKNIENYTTILDTLELARKIHPGKKNSLDALCKRYGIENNNRHLHGALLDAKLLAKLFIKITSRQTNLKFNNNNINKKINIHINNEYIRIKKANEYELKKHTKYMYKLNNNTK